MTGQITLFEVLEQIKPNWAKEIAKGLKEHCKKWGFDWVDKLQGKKTPERFYKLFCKTTKTYFFLISGLYYNTTFEKEGNVVIKHIGRDWDKRNEDAIIRIEEVLEEL